MSYENKSQYEDGRRSSGRGRGQASWKVYNHGPQHFGNERQSNMKSYSNANAGRYPDRSNFNQSSSNSRYFHSNSSPYNRDVEISKELVRIVRHGKYKQLKVDSEGYVKVTSILNDQRFQNNCGGVELKDIQRIVQENDKKRFEMKQVENDYFIKAVQGHTIQVESLALTSITNSSDYPNVFHGTYFVNWEEIKKTGLNRMKRNHIHFAIGLADDKNVISGMRQSCEVAIEIEMEKAMKAGIKFFLSSNKVVLSEGDAEGRIHPKFFRRVIDIYQFQSIPFQVPPDYDDNMPSGKRPTKQQTVPGYHSPHTEGEYGVQPSRIRAIPGNQTSLTENSVASTPKQETELSDNLKNQTAVIESTSVSKPDAELPDHFDDLAIQDDSLSKEAQPDNLQGLEKLSDAVVTKQQSKVLVAAEDVQTEIDASKLSTAKPKTKKRRAGKKSKNQDSVSKVPETQENTEIKFELPHQCKGKQSSDPVESSNETSRNENSKSTKDKNAKANKQNNAKSQEISKENAKVGGKNQKQKQKRKR